MIIHGNGAVSLNNINDKQLTIQDGVGGSGLINSSSVEVVCSPRIYEEEEDDRSSAL